MLISGFRVNVFICFYISNVIFVFFFLSKGMNKVRRIKLFEFRKEFLVNFEWRLRWL